MNTFFALFLTLKMLWSWPEDVNVHWFGYIFQINFVSLVCANSILMTPSSIRPSVACQHCQISSSLKPLGQLNSNFLWRLLRIMNQSLIKWSMSYERPKWLPGPYLVNFEPFKNRLLQNQKADDLGTWYAAFGMCGLPSLFKL